MNKTLMKYYLLAFCAFFYANGQAGQVIPQADEMKKLIKQHHKDYGPQEYFSAIQVTIKTPEAQQTYAVGTTGHNNATPVTENSLFNIGSITKSFTASLMLIAQREYKLHLDTYVNNYLDNYPQWGNTSLKALLNMTSGLPNYSASPKINYLFSQNLKKFWNKTELIHLVTTPNSSPPLKKGYYYTNTGYILSAMILESQYKKPFSQLLASKIINPLKLENTFYPSPTFSSNILARMAQGYNFNVYDNPELVGENVTENNLSWAGAAGGLVANSQDVIRWVSALFEGHDLLEDKERDLMQELVSTSTGGPIAKTNAKEPQGFGLGLIQAYDKDLGRYWFYEGETLGYRALYLYSPCNHVSIAALFNSAVNHQNDHSGQLMKALYQQTIKEQPTLACQSKAKGVV